jgi:20S proteasome alpha/beta subunit
VDLRGTAFTENYAASGFGTHMALPIIRDRWRPDLVCVCVL